MKTYCLHISVLLLLFVIDVEVAAAVECRLTSNKQTPFSMKND